MYLQFTKDFLQPCWFRFQIDFSVTPTRSRIDDAGLGKRNPVACRIGKFALKEGRLCLCTQHSKACFVKE